VEVALAYDQGFQFSVYNAVFSGFADLDSNVQATQQITYSFYGGTSPWSHYMSTLLLTQHTDYNVDTLTSTLSGPINFTYQFTDPQASSAFE
jgi:hypothetical protein